MEIKCNKCYQPLTVIEYDIGIFVEPCENCKISKEELNDIMDSTYDDGYNDCLIELKRNIINISDNINNVKWDIDGIIMDIEKISKKRENKDE